MEYSLNSAQYGLMMEALRRCSRFHNNRQLDLGTAYAGYGPKGKCYEYGSPYLEPALTASEVQGEYPVWWKLTAKGVAIIELWLKWGYSYMHIESGLTKNFPPPEGNDTIVVQAPTDPEGVTRGEKTPLLPENIPFKF